ncbi:MAG: hypothetical protein L6416_06310 [Candidatus Omnitrophica bacterium]|nr:hypothetical protein [Candidatus Omnitrophota bacterium]
MSGGINLYGYCGNNVTNNTDPKGLEYGVDTGWGWELGLFVSVGTFELTCCDDKCKKHLARYKKKCYGLYAGGSVGGGVVTGLSGASCPRGYEGWFSEGSPIPTPGAGADFAYSDDISRGPHYAGAGLGWSWGVRRCYYTLISDQIIGECK